MKNKFLIGATLLTLLFAGTILFLTQRTVWSEPARYVGKKVTKIEFQGLKNLSADKLIVDISTAVNEILSDSVVRNDIDLLYKTGKFEFIEVLVADDAANNGVMVKFVCKERPVISRIEYKGLDNMRESDFMDTLPIKEGDVLRIDKVESSVKVVTNKCFEKGYFNAAVTYKIEDKDKDENKVNVIFVVDEGEELRVQKISILGANKIKDSKLKGLLETKEAGPKILQHENFIRNGAFQQSKYEMDKDKILNYYRELGFLDAAIIEDKVEYLWLDPDTKTKRGIFITITVNEGEEYLFDSFTLEGNSDKVYTTEELTAEFTLRNDGNMFYRSLPKFVKKHMSEPKKKDKVFNNTSFMRDTQMISMLYGMKGFIYTRVMPEKTIEERVSLYDGKKHKYIKINYKIVENIKANIEKIIIKGNDKTEEQVIRREILVKEGEIFNTELIQLSRERVFNLGFFKQVNIDARPGSKEDNVYLIIDVEEQPTGTISLGGGYGNQNGFSIFADIGQNNFRGKGEKISSRLEYGPSKSSLSLSFSEPYVMGKPIGFDVSVFYNLAKIQTSSMFLNSSDLADYRKESLGYSLGGVYRFYRNYCGVGINFSHIFSRLKDPSGNAPDSIFKEVSNGMQQKRSVGLYAYYDSRDNYLNPTRGFMVKFSTYFTGGKVLGGNDHYVKYIPEFSADYSPFHIPFLKSHPCVIELRGAASFITPPLDKKYISQNQSKNPWLESSDYMDIGGAETLRGWEYYDYDFPRSWRSGQYHRILYGAEFKIPIHPTYLWTIFFFDAGSLWSDPYWEKNLDSSSLSIVTTDKNNGDLYQIRDIFKKETNVMSYFRYSYGFGFKIQIPMMPLRFWFGKKILWENKGFKPVDDKFNFQFSIGDIRYN